MTEDKCQTVELCREVVSPGRPGTTSVNCTTQAGPSPQVRRRGEGHLYLTGASPTGVRPDGRVTTPETCPTTTSEDFPHRSPLLSRQSSALPRSDDSFGSTTVRGFDDRVCRTGGGPGVKNGTLDVRTVSQRVEG